MTEFNERRIRTQIMLHHKFFGPLLHNIKFVESTDIPTAGINKWGVMMWNRTFMESLTEKEQIAVVCHEILHAAFGHVTRIFQMRRDLWQLGNIAGDYLVNEVIKSFMMQLPQGALYNKEYTVDKYTLEELVKKLLESSTKIEIPVLGFDVQEAQGKEGQDGQGSTEEAKKFEQKMKQSLITAVEVTKKAGKLPGSLERAMGEILKPKTNWRRELQEWFNVRIKSERSWHRPNRRFLRQGLYLPTKVGLGCGHIGIGVDVSGSIGQEDLNIFGSELNYLFQTCKPTKVTVVYFDSDIRKVEEHNELPIKLTACGGGGTNFHACFSKFESLDTPIEGMVFMSDGYDSWPEEPSYPVVMLSTTREVMPFGKTVFVDMTNETE